MSDDFANGNSAGSTTSDPASPDLASPVPTSPDDFLNYLHFELPNEYIAQRGVEPRDHSRLMVVKGASASQGVITEHRRFFELPELLQAGDVMVFNESRVIPARVMARKPLGQNGQGGGQIEVMLLREVEHLLWSAYLKPARRAGPELWLGECRAEVVDVLEDGARLLRFETDIKPHLEDIGRLPLPPYIEAQMSQNGQNQNGQSSNHDVDDANKANADKANKEYWDQRYQTVYARQDGSVAAPTAGLHFTPELLTRLDDLGVQRCAVTLHVGAGTFKPILGSVAEHVMHAEHYEVSAETAQIINTAKAEGRRIIAVGTTTVRTLESAWNAVGARDGRAGQLRAGLGETRLFLTPEQRVNVPDALITNFHLPASTLLLLVAAFAGPKQIKTAYQEALAEKYRFYSLGDAMWLNNRHC